MLLRAPPAGLVALAEPLAGAALVASAEPPRAAGEAQVGRAARRRAAQVGKVAQVALAAAARLGRVAQAAAAGPWTQAAGPMLAARILSRPTRATR